MKTHIKQFYIPERMDIESAALAAVRETIGNHNMNANLQISITDEGEINHAWEFDGGARGIHLATLTGDQWQWNVKEIAECWDGESIKDWADAMGVEIKEDTSNALAVVLGETGKEEQFLKEWLDSGGTETDCVQSVADTLETEIKEMI